MLAIFLILVLCCCCQGQEIEQPVVSRPGWELELIAREPQLVTPTACCFDHRRNRLLVVECHTHFPPEEYTGRKSDQIYAFDDSNGDGQLDRQTVYYQGGTATMGIVALEDGSVVVVTRADVRRYWDVDGNGKADKHEVLLQLKTKAEYPHNGLGGIAIGPGDSLLVGLGENFGEHYELVAKDGSKQVGSGEGGSIFRMSIRGANLERIARGFWNPFGICFDPAGRIWTVGNDPDAMPPCRLLHVIEGGDYGFQFRFGRGGRHPLQAWNGELPGTLPYAAGTGEAASGIAPIRNELWVTSWGDNRLEAYQLQPRGSSWKSGTDVVLQGGPNFRPVGIAQGPDGSVYLTDWVDRSYSVHGKGRLWRLRPTSQPEQPAQLPGLTSAERDRLKLADSSELTKLVAALNHADPFVHQHAMHRLATTELLESVDAEFLTSERVRTGVLAAWRWREISRPGSVSPEHRQRLVRQSLNQPESGPLLIALRWAAERDDSDLLPQIESCLSKPNLSPEVFRAIVATASYLRSGTAKSGVRDPAREELVLSVARDQQQPAKIRAMAARMIPAVAKQPNAEQLENWIRSTDYEPLHQEIVALLQKRKQPEDVDLLMRIASDSSLPTETRADAIVGLDPRQHANQLLSLLKSSDQGIRLEAERRSRRTVDTSKHPDATDTDAWLQLVGEGGDRRAGRRVFLRLTCSRCHAHSGRGATTGPELTSLQGQSRRRLLESILQPSKEIGPIYVPWQIVTQQGKVLLGLKSVTSGVGPLLNFQNPDGTEFQVHLNEIQSQQLATLSIMPNGLERTMAVDELRDLLAFLSDEVVD